MTPAVRQHHEKLRCYPQECSIFLKPIANVWHNLPIARIQTSRKQRCILLTITAKNLLQRYFFLPSPTNLADLETLISKEEVSVAHDLPSPSGAVVGALDTRARGQGLGVATAGTSRAAGGWGEASQRACAPGSAPRAGGLPSGPARSSDRFLPEDCEDPAGVPRAAGARISAGMVECLGGASLAVACASCADRSIEGRERGACQSG
nr:uncharacterized protein LOC129524492 [Gorilla gorilla gorilla]